MTNPTVTKIVLDIKGVEISLSPSEATGLRDELNRLFPLPRTEYVRSYPWQNLNPWYTNYGTSGQLASSGLKITCTTDSLVDAITPENTHGEVKL